MCVCADYRSELRITNDSSKLGTSVRARQPWIVQIHSLLCNNRYTHIYMGTVRPKSRQGNTTNLNISFSIENEKRAAQV